MRKITIENVLISALAASAKIPECVRGGHLAMQIFWTTARLLVTRVSLIYLVDMFFIFSFLVLLKAMRTRGEFKNSPCYFCHRIRWQWESKITLCNPSGGKLLLRLSLSYNKLLGRIAFRILSNIHGGALLGK